MTCYLAVFRTVYYAFVCLTWSVDDYDDDDDDCNRDDYWLCEVQVACNSNSCLLAKQKDLRKTVEENREKYKDLWYKGCQSYRIGGHQSQVTAGFHRHRYRVLNTVDITVAVYNSTVCWNPRALIKKMHSWMLWMSLKVKVFATQQACECLWKCFPKDTGCC